MKELFKVDIDEVFFNEDEFGIFVIVKKNSNNIVIQETDEYEVASSRQRAFYIKNKDIKSNDIRDGDILIFEDAEHEVLNFNSIDDRRVSLLVVKNA